MVRIFFFVHLYFLILFNFDFTFSSYSSEWGFLLGRSLADQFWERAVTGVLRLLQVFLAASTSTACLLEKANFQGYFYFLLSVTFWLDIFFKWLPQRWFMDDTVFNLVHVPMSFHCLPVWILIVPIFDYWIIILFFQGLHVLFLYQLWSCDQIIKNKDTHLIIFPYEKSFLPP